MGQIIAVFLLQLLALAFIGFVIFPIVGFLFLGSVTIGPEAVWGALVWLWDVHWCLPFVALFSIPVIGIGTIASG